MSLDRKWCGILSLLMLPALFACQGKPPAVPSAAEAPSDKDRHELVLQSRDGWKPESPQPKLKIQLINEKNALSKDGEFRYRMEIKNVGRDAVAFKESAPSFIKDGSLCGPSDFSFFVTPPGGAEQPLPCDDSSLAAPGSGLDLILRSGEYLLTRPESASNRFRSLRTKYHFDKFGSYRIRAVYAGSGLRSESNAVVFDRRAAPYRAAAQNADNARQRERP